MILGRSVLSVEGQQLIVRGTVLQPYYIERLQQAGFGVVYVLDDEQEHTVEEDIVSEGTRLDTLFAVHNTILRIAAIAKGARTNINQQEIEKAVEGLLDELIRHRHRLVTLVDPTTYDDHLAAHCVNVCMLSLLTGISLGYNILKLKQLGVGALLHDVGMATMPREIWRKAGKLTPEERKQVETHCLAGWRILQANANFKATSLAVVLQHEERYDGMGYPKGLKGENIHEFARVTAIADVYDALVQHKIYHPGYPPHEAMRIIREGCGTLFDPLIAEETLRHVSPYPVGTRVRLNSGDQGVVVQEGTSDHGAPVVCLLSSSEPVNLAEHPELEVAEVLSY